MNKLYTARCSLLKLVDYLFIIGHRKNSVYNCNVISTGALLYHNTIK